MKPRSIRTPQLTTGFVVTIWCVLCSPWSPVLAQTDLASTAQSIADLQHVLGSNYVTFCAVYWRYLILPCDVIERKYEEDMEDGQLAKFCHHVQTCPELSPQQSCMVQLTVVAIRLACCQEPTIDLSQHIPNAVTQSPQEPRTPVDLMEGFKHFDPEAQHTCNFGRYLPSRRIVGGSAARRGEFPWMVMLLRDGVFLCAGTVLDATHLLTAAHCFDKHSSENKYSVLAGKYIADVHETEQTQQLLPVTSFVLHQDYNRLLKWNDIAVVQLSMSLNWTEYVMPACIPAPGDAMEKYCTVAGWGLVDDLQPAAVLMKTTLESFNRTSCVHTFLSSAEAPLQRYLHPGVICAANGDRGGRDACQGDSGGPLMCVQSSGNSSAYFVYGIVSNGNGCGVPGEPGLYVSLAYYVTWITDTISAMTSSRGIPL